jgi:hypothetical protein
MFANFLNKHGACDVALRLLDRRSAKTFAQAWDALSKSGRWRSYRGWGIEQLFNIDDFGYSHVENDMYRTLDNFIWADARQRRHATPRLSEVRMRRIVLAKWRKVRGQYATRA